MPADYESEQAELKSGTAALRSEVEEIRSKTANIARTFIEKVIVHKQVHREKSKEKISQEI